MKKRQVMLLTFWLLPETHKQVLVPLNLRVELLTALQTLPLRQAGVSGKLVLVSHQSLSLRSHEAVLPRVFRETARGEVLGGGEGCVVVGLRRSGVELRVRLLTWEGAVNRIH